MNFIVYYLLVNKNIFTIYQKWKLQSACSLFKSVPSGRQPAGPPPTMLGAGEQAQPGGPRKIRAAAAIIIITNK